MYIPKHNQIHDVATCVSFMQMNIFATVISLLDGALFASHLPLLTTVRDEQVIITGHFAKANPHWHAFEAAPASCLVIFTGPHAFVSPSTYTLNHGIPTWNYVAVHVSGRVRISHDEADKRAMLHALHGANEPANEAAFAAQLNTFQRSQLDGIVWFEVDVDKIEGKEKLSQNHTIENQHRAGIALSGSADPSVAEIGRLMQSSSKARRR